MYVAKVVYLFLIPNFGYLFLFSLTTLCRMVYCLLHRYVAVLYNNSAMPALLNVHEAYNSIYNNVVPGWC